MQPQEGRAGMPPQLQGQTLITCVPTAQGDMSSPRGVDTGQQGLLPLVNVVQGQGLWMCTWGQRAETSSQCK